jgi:arsenite methyltransferase
VIVVLHKKLKKMNKINYGFDAPAIMRNLISFGLIVPLIGLLISYFTDHIILGYISFLVTIIGIILLILGISMYIYGIKGKFNMRDFMLSKIAWKGNENVLDIGTGLGIYMIGAAKHLTTGKSIGIDIWRAEDLSGNNIENAYKNAELENVRGKVEIKNEDARKLNFQDNSFDIILSMYCIHNIDDKTEQEKACFEIARVLKPNGTALIGDYIPTHEYAKYFEKAGLKVISSKNYISTAYTLMWMVEATKI